MARKARSLEERLVDRLDGVGNNECWLWRGCITKPGKGTPKGYHVGGYGQIRARESEVNADGDADKWITIHAHRAAHILWIGPVPDGAHIHHTCEQKACCNPEHLKLVTPSEHKAEHFPVANRYLEHGETDSDLDEWWEYLEAQKGQ